MVASSTKYQVFLPALLDFHFSTGKNKISAQSKGRSGSVKAREINKGFKGTTMAPHGEGSDAAVEVMVVQIEKHPISSILVIIGMQTEALPVVNKFRLIENPHSTFPEGHYNKSSLTYKDIIINLVWPGKDLTLGVDSVGTISASLVTYASIQALQPDLIINAGTAGGFKAKGAGIGDVFLVSHVAFHDRRIPIPVINTGP